MFLYRRWHSPTPHAYGRTRRSASFSTSRSSDSESVTSLSDTASPAARAFSLRLLASSSCRCSRSFGGAKLHDPCVMWYLSPFACLYDLLQFGFGHLNGFESRRDVAGRDSVVLARGVCEAPCEDDEDAWAELDEEGAGTMAGWIGYVDVWPETGDATRDWSGVLAGVVALLLRRSAGGTHPVRAP